MNDGTPTYSLAADEELQSGVVRKRAKARPPGGSGAVYNPYLDLRNVPKIIQELDTRSTFTLASVALLGYIVINTWGPVDNVYTFVRYCSFLVVLSFLYGAAKHHKILIQHVPQIDGYFWPFIAAVALLITFNYTSVIWWLKIFFIGA